MEFVLATNNKGKLAEVRRILKDSGHTVLSLADIGLQIDPEETGLTFAENALIKAQAVCQACGKPVLADDSGLCVDALNGAPGVNSARFAGHHGDDAANNQKLLTLLGQRPCEERTARFVCAIVLVMPGGACLQVEGRCEGYIGLEAAGTGGFGYDPLFYVGSQSFAEISAEEKDGISHRAQALRKLGEKLPIFLAENPMPE